MYMPNKFKPISKKLHRICCILMITVFTVSPQNTTADCPGQDFLSCPPQTCGNNGLEISYPFWVSQQQEVPSCGYPMFQVTCSHNNYPVLTISNQDFVIKDIFYSDHSLLVAIAAVYNDGGGCPVPSKALSLLQNPTFKYTRNANLEFSFFYNCCFEPPEQINPFPVDCASNATHHSFGAFRNEALLGQYIDYSLCQSVVDVAVHVPAEYTNNFSSWLLGTNYVDILEMGFLLSWDTQACCDCHNTGGSCGYCYDAFVCLCDGWPNDATCSDDRDDKGRSKKKRRWFRTVVDISITTFSAAGGSAVAVYVVHRYREKILITKIMISLKNFFRPPTPRCECSDKDKTIQKEYSCKALHVHMTSCS